MAKKPRSEACDFWKRMTAAWRSRGLPVSQNGVARKLAMSQGSTRRWYTGEGLPEVETIVRIAQLGHVTVDYLLKATMPRSEVSPGSALERMLFIWDALDDEGRKHLLISAEGAIARSAKKYSTAVVPKSDRQAA